MCWVCRDPNMSGIFLDDQAFQTAGVPAPQPGWTWDNFRQAAAYLALHDAGEVRYGFADPTYTSVVAPLVENQFLKTDGGIDPQSLANELQWYVDLAKQGALYPVQGAGGGDSSQQAEERWKALFQGNRSPAMWLGRLQDPVPGLAGVSEDTDPARLLAINRFGFAPFPVAFDDSNSKTTPLAAQCIAMSAGTKSPQAAWQWIKFLSNQRLQHDTAQMAEQLSIPARSSVADSSGFWAQIPGGLRPAVQFGLAHGKYPREYSTATAAVYAALEQAAVEGKDLTQALTEAQTKLNAAPPSMADDSSPVVIATPENADLSGEKPVVRFFAGTSHVQEAQTLQSIVERFNREHNASFSVSLVPSYSFPENQGYFESLASSFDCFVAQVDPLGAAASDAVLDLNSFLESEPASFRLDYDPALLDRSRIEGTLYDLPLVIQPAIMAYNAEALTSRGLPLPSDQWTYADFMQQITAVAASKGPDRLYGVLPESQAVDMTGMLLAGRNVEWLDVSGSAPVAVLDTPEMANSLNWLSELYRSGVIFQSAAGENWWRSITSAIQSGQIAYWTVLAGQQTSLYFDESQQQPPFQIGIAPLPATTSSVAFGTSIERGLYIARQSPNAPACWAWARYLSEQPVSWEGVPARTSVATSPAWESSVGSENAKVYRTAITRLQGMRVDGKWKVMLLPLNSWRSQAEIGARNGEDIQQLLAAAQQKAAAYQTCLSQWDITSFKETKLREKVTNCAGQADPSW